MAASQASTGASSPGADADPASLAQAPDLAVAGVELSGAQADALAASLAAAGASLPAAAQLGVDSVAGVELSRASS